MNKNDYTTIIKLIEIKFGRGSSANWKNRDFEDLNFQITKETKTNISAHTLKRIFGKIKTDEYYLPQKATIIALKEYVNYENQKIQPEDINIPDLTPNPPASREINKRAHFFVITILLISILLSLYYFFFRENLNIDGIIKVVSTEGQIPKTVQFEYSTPNNNESFSICYDGNFPPIPVPNGKLLKSSYYYQYPGLFKVRMWKNSQIVSPSISVYVPTKGWEVYGSYSQQKQLERFYHINLQKCVRNNIFQLSKTDLFNEGLDTMKLTEVTLNNYHPTGFNGDNFKLETTLKNSDVWAGTTCNSIFLYITGKKESIQLHFANPGCSYWIHCRLSEKKMDKQNGNLKNFTFNLAHWQNFKIENKNKHISISVNNIERFSGTYNESIGEIVGVTIRFQGNGYMKNYQMYSLEGKPIFLFPV